MAAAAAFIPYVHNTTEYTPKTESESNDNNDDVEN